MKLEDVDIISVLRKYLSELFKNNFAKFIFKSEKDHYLSPFLFNKLKKEINRKIIKKEEQKEKEINQNEIKRNEKEEEINEIRTDKIQENKEENKEQNKEQIINEVKEKNDYDITKNKLISKLEEKYLDKLDISQTKDFNKNMKKNQITLVLGLKLPAMKNIINNIRLYIKTNISEKYYRNENFIRQIEEEIFIEKENKIINTLNKNRKNVEIEIKKHEILQTLEELKQSNPEDYNQIYDLLLQDYYLIFLSEIIPNIKNRYNELGDYINILSKMIKLRFENEINILEDINIQPIEIFSKEILWLEAYSRFIAIILNIYQDLLEYKKDLYNEIDKKIEEKEIQYEI